METLQHEQIGEVEIMKWRIVPLDGSIAPDEVKHRLEVVVAPGRYPVFNMGVSYFWLLTGQLNVGRMFRHGDGMFSMQNRDKPAGPAIVFPSKIFGPDEFREFLESDEVAEGHPEQRFRFTLTQDLLS